MKVALIVPGGVDPSGEVRVIPALVALIGRLAAAHEVHVFATHQDASPGSWMLGRARVHNLGLPRTAWRAAKSIVREHRARPFHVLHAFWSGAHGALAVGLGKWVGAPSVVHVAGGELVDLRDIGYGGCRSWRGRVRERVVLREATVVTCASQPVSKLIAERGVSAEIVPLGVDLERWPLRAPLRRRVGEPLRLLQVASLNAVKDQSTLLRALRRLADEGREFHLDIVGEDTLGGRVQAHAEELGIAHRIRFHGFLTQRDLRPIVETAHIAVVSSRHEAGPVVALEAAVAGVPTVGTDVGHIAEWGPRAALAVRCRDADALAAAVAKLIDNEDLRLALAEAAQGIARRDDADRTARAFNEIYRRVASQRVASGVPA
jgi:glycosyltransferase involved in cell wall biosynthesis